MLCCCWCWQWLLSQKKVGENWKLADFCVCSAGQGNLWLANDYCHKDFPWLANCILEVSESLFLFLTGQNYRGSLWLADVCVQQCQWPWKSVIGWFFVQHRTREAIWLADLYVLYSTTEGYAVVGRLFVQHRTREMLWLADSFCSAKLGKCCNLLTDCFVQNKAKAVMWLADLCSAQP